jgi:hypothetical protein
MSDHSERRTSREDAVFQRLKYALLGQTSTQERQPDDVDALVASYPSQDTTKLLLSFGEKLLKANDDRVAAIDAKATALVGYGTAILALLVTRNLSVSGSLTRALLLAATGGFATVACVSAGLALRATRNWRNLSEATWFPSDLGVVSEADALGRWYLRAMHQTLQENHRIANQKAGEMIVAQLCVTGAGICLALLFMAGPTAIVLARLTALLNDVQSTARIALASLIGA